MLEKLLLYITDEGAILYTGTDEQRFKGPLSEALHHLETLVSQKVLLRLLIDRSHHDIREEKLPPLFLWDRIRLLANKRAECLSQGGYAGFQIFKQEKTHYLRWVHILESDPLIPFIQKATNGIFFASLEGKVLLKQEGYSAETYQMLSYPLPFSKTRHVVFKGERMLLSRLSQEGEDETSTLHFLSRTYPDSLKMFHVKQLPNSQVLTRAIRSQKRPTLSFPYISPIPKLMRGVGGVAVAIALFIIILELYRGISFNNKELEIIPRITSLEEELEKQKSVTDVDSLRKALDYYIHLTTLKSDPLKIFSSLFKVLEKHQVRLVQLDWSQSKVLDLVLTFLNEENIHVQFDPFLVSCEKAFPASQIQVLEAPYHSHGHEVFTGTQEMSPPLSHIRIVMP